MTSGSKTIYVSENGDRWDLLRNGLGEMVVRHTANLSSGGNVADISLDEFLRVGRNGPEHQAVRKLIGALCDDHA
jgi:hypothetical protein